MAHILRALLGFTLSMAALPAQPAEAHGPRAPLAFTFSGLVRGLDGEGVEQFLGIPFAAPPTGTLRWRPPQPVPWFGFRQADALPPACAQLPSTNGPGSAEEDCLYLSIYRPERRMRLRPVLVWIHGGGGLNGAGNQHDASELARETGTVVVTINYRLGVFGFLALPGLTAEAADGVSGNLGLQDQQAALRWVKQNILFFGGDPRRITVAGQSAGGHSVCVHLASPTAAGLFERAIIHSGAFDLLASGSGVPCDTVPVAEAEAGGVAFAEGAGCADGDTQVDCLRAKTAEELVAASAAFAVQLPTGGELLPMPVVDAIAAGAWNRVPVLVGSTHDELQPAAVVAGLGFPLNPFVYELATGVVFGANADLVRAEYPLASFSDPAFAFGAELTDAAVACPTHALRELLAQHTRTYGFEFDDPEAPPGEFGGMPAGAYHTSDVPYLFEFSTIPSPATPEQEALSDQMMRYWAAFAARGRPAALGEPFWRPFRSDDPQVMSLAPSGSHLTVDFATDHHCAFWETLAP
jgi:para-nitrobenzyl esterase